ncbi:MAG: hypothetical protein JWR07_3685 [Nevskia sp.]|nr:hypothetical protein [Nevskia sp.]
MSGRDRIVKDAGLLQPLAAAGVGVVIGELLGIGEDQAPFVIYPGQPGTAAIAAGSVVDLYGAHIGRRVVLEFDGGDPHKPIVMGVLREPGGNALVAPPRQVTVDADGERMTVAAREQLVLSCGKASITLTRAGKVVIRGSYILSRSTGANSIKGGSIDLN